MPVYALHETLRPSLQDGVRVQEREGNVDLVVALTVTLLERAQNHSSSSSSHDEHPLLCDNPHGIVPFLEVDVFLESSSPNLAKFSNQPEAFSCLYMFEGFCNGAIFYGPFWDHLLGYWRRSLEDRRHALFMRYGEMKTEPRDQINKLADFLGCPFTRQEEENGFVDEVLDLCSLPNLSGEVGGSKNYLTPEMENKIEMIIQEKLQGSGLKL
ncbi:hypothetical protein HID58_085413 [Brassica napus]|uniref:Sulfotransferase n=1 Tax=Brassica napus TaxID=3708 RepID=A0ABQ7XMJ0_BRANA|nr:hypothetical protein HID58_085413 [Brassica napus]